MSKRHWQQKAFSNAHGQFKRQARAHDMGTKEYARYVTRKNSRASTHVKRQAQLVLNSGRRKKRR